MPETVPQYDYKRYFRDIFPPNSESERIEKFLRKIRDLILVAKIEAVGDDDELYKGQTVADIRCAFNFPSEVFFDLHKSQIVPDLKYYSEPIHAIKLEYCYLSIEDYLNREIKAETSQGNSPSNDDKPVESSEAIVIARDEIKVLTDDKNLPISKSSPKKIITNRQLNFTFSPVDTYNPKEMPYRLHNYEIDGTWNHHHSIILDAVLDRIFNVIYQPYGSPPKSWRSKKTIDAVDKFSGEMINPSYITYMNSSPIEAFVQKNRYDFRDKLKEDYDYRKDLNEQISFEQHVDNHLSQNQEYQEFIRTMSESVKVFYADYTVRLSSIAMLEAYPFLKRYQYNLIKKLKEIEQTRFKMTYKVKFMQEKPTFDENGKVDGRGKLIDLHYQMNEFQPLFEVMAASKDKIVLNFKSPLGKFIVHNMLILDTDWCPVEAMSLSKNAYFIYKRFILNSIAGRRKKEIIDLKLDEVKAFLDLRWSNDRGIHRIIKTAIENLKQNALIVKSDNNKKVAKNRIYELHFKNDQKDAEK